MKKSVWSLMLCLCMIVSLFPANALAEDTFTITYKTNAGVTMGTVTYTVGDAANNHLPELSQFNSLFGAFLTKASANGSIYVMPDNRRWWNDADFTSPASFPDGKAGESFTIYCQFSCDLQILGGVVNNAYDVPYSKTYDTAFPTYLAVSSYSGPSSRWNELTACVFEKQQADGSWEEVPISKSSNAYGHWTNFLFITSVADNGIYRLKYMVHTATDSSGNALYYDYAYPLNPDETFEVKINPQPITISGVTAVDRAVDGTETVNLSGGVLEGVLDPDQGKVGFALGKGTVTDGTAGNGKPVATSIQLTGEKAVNYVLTQPTDLTVNIVEVPKTGDSSQPMIWLLLSALSLVGIVLIVRKRGAME